MLTLTNEWIELGEEKGIEKGLELGEERWRASEARSLILRLGTKRLGTAAAEVSAALEAADLARLEVLADRLLEVESWAELLAA